MEGVCILRCATAQEAKSALRDAQPERFFSENDRHWFDDKSSTWHLADIDPSNLYNVRFDEVMGIQHCKRLRLTAIRDAMDKDQQAGALDKIKEYADKLKEGSNPPPIIVFCEDGKLGIYDGFKRSCIFLERGERVKSLLGRLK